MTARPTSACVVAGDTEIPFNWLALATLKRWRAAIVRGAKADGSSFHAKGWSFILPMTLSLPLSVRRQSPLLDYRYFLNELAVIKTVIANTTATGKTSTLGRTVNGDAR